VQVGDVIKVQTNLGWESVTVRAKRTNGKIDIQFKDGEYMRSVMPRILREGNAPVIARDAEGGGQGGPSGSGSGVGFRVGSGSGTSGSLCSPNPCGREAECKEGLDRSGEPRPICTCPRGYRGNALVACRRGECFNDSECSPDRACFDYKCKDPCKGPDTSCGANANCKVVNHGAVCSCPSGYQGNPLSSCVSSRRG